MKCQPHFHQTSFIKNESPGRRGYRIYPSSRENRFSRLCFLTLTKQINSNFILKSVYCPALVVTQNHTELGKKTKCRLHVVDATILHNQTCCQHNILCSIILLWNLISALFFSLFLNHFSSIFSLSAPLTFHPIKASPSLLWPLLGAPSRKTFLSPKCLSDEF